MATLEQTRLVGEQQDVPKSIRPRHMTPPPAPRIRASGSGPQQSSASMPQSHGTSQSVAGAKEVELRAGFMRKVYGILSAQMLVTVTVAAVCSLVSSMRSWILATRLQGWLKLIMLIPTMVCLLGLQWKGRVYPYNFYLLFGFTLCISLNVGFVCAFLFEAGLAHLLIQAVAITAVIFLGLSVYVMRSQQNFGILRAFLPLALSTLLLTNFGAWSLGLPMLDTIATWCGAVIFCGYIIYDTHLISKRFDYDDYILGAAELYLDVINLFFHVLQILLNKEKSKNNTKKSK